MSEYLDRKLVFILHLAKTRISNCDNLVEIGRFIYLFIFFYLYLNYNDMDYGL